MTSNANEECEAFRVEEFNFVAERLIKKVSWDEFERYIKGYELEIVEKDE